LEPVITLRLFYQTHWNDPIYLSAFEAVYPYPLTNLTYIDAFNDELLVEYKCENRRNLDFSSEYAEFIIAYFLDFLYFVFYVLLYQINIRIANI